MVRIGVVGNPIIGQRGWPNHPQVPWGGLATPQIRLLGHPYNRSKGVANPPL
jgi:hypothetical protein